MLNSFSTDWFDLLAVQGTPKSLLQHHSSPAGITGADSSIIGKKQKLTQYCASAAVAVQSLSHDGQDSPGIDAHVCGGY